MTSLTDTLKELSKPFPAEAIKQINKGGTRLDYVPVSEAIAQMNRAAPEWSIVESEAWVDSNNPEWVIAKVTVEVNFQEDRNVITRRHIGWGGQKIKLSKGAPLDLGDEFKGATSDALKKALQQLGVGLSLARSEEMLAWEEDNTVPADAASEADIEPVQAKLKGLDDEAKKAAVKWFHDNEIPRLSSGKVTETHLTKIKEYLGM